MFYFEHGTNCTIRTLQLNLCNITRVILRITFQMRDQTSMFKILIEIQHIIHVQKKQKCSTSVETIATPVFQPGLVPTSQTHESRTTIQKRPHFCFIQFTALSKGHQHNDCRLNRWNTKYKINQSQHAILNKKQSLIPKQNKSPTHPFEKKTTDVQHNCFSSPCTRPRCTTKNCSKPYAPSQTPNNK